MLQNLKEINLKRYNAMHVILDFKTLAAHLLGFKTRYQGVEKLTGVPWPIIAAIHHRESSHNFNTQLAQGDPLSQVSTHVPIGQGPYFGQDAWERAAARALIETGGKTWEDWTPGGWTTYLEKYNGLGYANHGRPSPYVWAGTDQYRLGKYVSDGVYDAEAIDTQPGCVALIAALAKQDPTINLNNLASIAPVKKPIEPTKETHMLNWKTTIAGVAAIFSAIGMLFSNGVVDWSHLSTVIPAIIAGFGLMFAKDSTVHSTPAEVVAAGVVSHEPQPTIAVK